MQVEPSFNTKGDQTVEQPSPLRASRLHALWSSLDEHERFSFMAEALSEAAAARLRQWQVQRYEQEGPVEDQ